MIEALDFIFPDVEENGLYLNNIYFPEEIITHILSYIPIEGIWTLRLVCKQWYNLTKSTVFWSSIFKRMHKQHPKKFPWYVSYKCLDNSIFDINLLKNNCGQEKFNHWKILKDSGNRLKIEDTPCGSDPLPTDIPDFNGAKSCFVTSYTTSNKMQLIHLNGNLSRYVIKKFKPHIYVSEWYAGRFDCGGCYELKAAVYKLSQENSNVEDHQILVEKKINIKFEGNQATDWQKVEIVFDSYSEEIDGILFEHKARDNQFWAGHYGPKMAGGMVKFLSHTMKAEKVIEEKK